MVDWGIPKEYRIKLYQLIDSVLKLNNVEAWFDFLQELNEQTAILEKKFDLACVILEAHEASSAD